MLFKGFGFKVSLMRLGERKKLVLTQKIQKLGFEIVLRVYRQKKRNLILFNVQSKQNKPQGKFNVYYGKHPS